MRVAARTLSRAAMFAVAFSPLILTAAPAAADDSAAHAIAEKFSRAEEAERAAAERKKSEVKKKADAEKARAEAARRKAAADQRAKDEAELLERARAEAEARQQEEQRAAERLRAEAQRQAARAEAERLAREAELRRQEDERKAEEARQAEAQRLAKEVEEKRLAEERKAEEKRLAEERRAARLAKEAEEARRAEAIRKAEEKRQADAAREALERQRTEEAERVAEKFRQAHEAREAKLARERDAAARERGAAARERGTDSRNSLGGPGPDTTTAPWDITDNGPARFLPTRATILLIMDPRRRVFAAYPPRANPVLCIGQGCYVSAGANAPAQHMPRWSALGPANSIGRRAGPCRNQLTCVFRDVELGGGYGQIQPVDMGLLHHDRREIRGVRPDPTCDLVGGRLFCAEPVVARGYRAWIVPELIATKAGPDALREALALGLPTARAAALDPWRGEVHAKSSR